MCSVFLYQIMQSTASKFARQRKCPCGEPETLPDGERSGVMNHNFRSVGGGAYRSFQRGSGRPKNAIEVREYWKQKIREGDRAKREGRGRRKRSTNETVGSDDDRIVNGYNVDTQPWLASLLHIQYKYNAITCGGALINRRYVL